MASVGDATASGALLLIEDDPDHAFLVGRRLAQHAALGLRVEHSGTMATATKRLALGDIRCVVLDLSLPDAQGMQAVHAVRAVDPGVPIVVLTGLDSDEAGLEALHAGAQDYLVKGRHTPDALSRSVLFAMERVRRQEAEGRQAVLDNELAVREAQLSEAQRFARVGSWDWDVRGGEVLLSEQLRRLTGLRQFTGTDVFEQYLALVEEEDRGAAARLFSLEATDDPPAVSQHRLRCADGTVRWVHGQMTPAAWDEEGNAIRVLGTVQDIHEQKRAAELLGHQALHDSLTGLANRSVLLDRLGRVLTSSRRDGSLVAVIFLDLDQFKWVNDSRGHSCGDRLLVQVARVLEREISPTDTLARFGGDEFVVLCERVYGEDEVLHLVRRLSFALEHADDHAATVGTDLEGITVTASIGVATAVPGFDTDPELVIRDADIAMYRAKERGRARWEIFDEDMRSRAATRLETQRDLAQAVQRGELQVHFQPVVDLHTGRVTGSEALARWLHPTRGLLMPAEFVPHAEETGLIVGLGAAVLQSACVRTAAWNRKRPEPLDVAVNLSARQLTDPGLPDVVAAALETSGLAPALLCLEVTETVLMEDAEASARVLSRLREVGIRVAIDDFGTGYSSMAYLLSLPVDMLKVDRSFVAAVDRGRPGRAIVTAVLALAGALGLDVVAEGIETRGQRDALVALGVDSGQGWYWSRAVAAAEATWAASGGHLVGGRMSVLDLPSSRSPLAVEQFLPSPVADRRAARGR